MFWLIYVNHCKTMKIVYNLLLKLSDLITDNYNIHQCNENLIFIMISVFSDQELDELLDRSDMMSDKPIKTEIKNEEQSTNKVFKVINTEINSTGKDHVI